MSKDFKIIGQLKDNVANRIVSLAPSFTDTLVYLNLSHKLVGITENCRFSGANDVATIGSFARPDIAQIQKLKPDLILGLKSMHDRHMNNIDLPDCAILLLESETIFGILQTIDKISELGNADRESKERIENLNRRLQSVSDRVQSLNPPRVFRLMSEDPLITPTVATHQYDAIRLAGGQPMFSENSEPYATVTPEDILKFDPEIIMSCGRKEHDEAKQRCSSCPHPKPPCIRLPSDVAAIKGLATAKAVKNHKIFTLYCEASCHHGPHLIDGIEEMARIFHPNVFTSVR